MNKKACAIIAALFAAGALAAEPLLATRAVAGGDAATLPLQGASAATLEARASAGDITFSPAPLAATESYGTPVHEDNDGKKHYLVAFTGAFVTDALIFSWNRLVLGAGWTRVTPEHAAHFYEHEPEWDTDWYWTNFVLHPYQGALSYMVGRSANLNRIESFALATLFDFGWEYFCETTSPSKNDMVYSSLGAFPVGEMLYRLSLEAEQLHALFGYVVNPERLWSEFWTRQKPRGTVGNIHELALSFAVGTTYARTTFGYDIATQNELFPVFASPKIAIVYNDPYGHDSNNPYSQFNMDIRFAFGAPSGEGITSLYEKLFFDISIMSDGMLLARAPELGDTAVTLGPVLEYDFIWNNVVQLSSLAPGFAFKQRIPLANSDIEYQLHAAWLALGTTQFDYLYRGVVAAPDYLFREYSYTTGAELVARFRWRTLAGQALTFDLHGYAMYDFADQEQDCADTGWELIALATAGYELPLSRVVRLGIEDQLYAKRTLYRRLEDVTLLTNSARVFVKWQLK